MPVKKIITGGDKDFPYNLPENSAIEQFIIKVFNETSKQLSFYTFKKTEGCFKTIESEDSPLIMTIYGCNANNEVLNEDYYQIPSSGQAEKQSYEPHHWNPKIASLRFEAVKEKVSSPNISHPLITLEDPPKNNTDPNSYVLIVRDLETDIKLMNTTTSVGKEITDSSIILKSRREYSCVLHKVEKNGNKLSVTDSSPNYCLKSRNSMRDVEELKTKAASYIGCRIEYEVKYLYRNKPSSDSTITKSKSTGILKKYMKDNNGDKFSSINRNICGLHFSATPVNSSGDLPSGSYFGDYRIMVPPEYLVEGNNLYFTDFFCMSRIHWVTLVLTKPGSDEDKFCENRLVKLDIHNNPFFYKSGNEYKVTSLDVEILYTEDINLTEMRQKVGFQETTTSTCGKGRSKANGVPKNSSCSICNL